MIYRNPRPKEGLDAAFDMVPEKVENAARVASKALSDAGVRHLIIGGLAVGAHGYPRATKDVDFLVGEEAFDHHGGGLVTTKSGIPVAVGDVRVDLLSIDEVTEADIEETPDGELQIAPVEVLIYLKLKSTRRRDRHDIVELIQAGIDTDVVMEYLEERDTGLGKRFESLIAVADDE